MKIIEDGYVFLQKYDVNFILRDLDGISIPKTIFQEVFLDDQGDDTAFVMISGVDMFDFLPINSPKKAASNGSAPKIGS